MPSLRERDNSRESVTNLLTGQTTSVVLHYVIDDVVDDLAAKSLLISSTPATYDDLIREEIGIRPIFVDTEILAGRWDAFVRYVQPSYNVGDSSYEFEIAGETVNRKFALAHVADFGKPGVPANKIANHRGAINVGKDGQPDGADVRVPIWNWSETFIFAPAAITAAFKQNLYAVCVAPVNNAAFRGFAAGEVLYLGTTGRYSRSQGYWELTYRFAASPNVTNLTVDTITGVAKKGWEFGWVEFEPVKDGTNLVARPEFVHVEKNYAESDFTLLGIGTG